MSKEKHSPVTIDATTGTPDPTPPKIKLNSIGDVRREMGTIYREARAGKLDISDAGRLAYVLTGIGKLIEVELIEQRLAQLERKLLK
jgi:hypothetical protein